MVFTIGEAKVIGGILGVEEWNKFNVGQFRKGMNVELEHGKINALTNVTNDNPLTTGKITLAHLNENPKYYDMLEFIESGKCKIDVGKKTLICKIKH